MKLVISTIVWGVVTRRWQMQDGDGIRQASRIRTWCKKKAVVKFDGLSDDERTNRVFGEDVIRTYISGSTGQFTRTGYGKSTHNVNGRIAVRS